MKSILYRQQMIQEMLSSSMVRGGIVPPYIHNVNIGAKYDTILAMQHFMNQEVDELLLALSDNNRSIHKPWKKECVAIRAKPFVSTQDIKGEAMDILCFAMNICLAAGITPDNIDEEYDKVAEKIVGRFENAS